MRDHSDLKIGITISERIGIGDGLQFSSLPENYYRHTGRRLYDLSRPWFFDHNPYVIRESNPKVDKIQELWNFGPTQYEWPRPRPSVYVSNAEIWASLFKVSVYLNRPRLYQFEDFPFEERKLILFHTHGRSHGELPKHVIDHVIRKYKPTKYLFHLCMPSDPDIGIPKINCASLWELANVISEAKLFIGIDSGPSWIAACYPDVVVKKIRNKEVHGEKPFHEWVPLEIDNFHSHWDDRLFQIYHNGEFGDRDLQFMSSYKKI